MLSLLIIAAVIAGMLFVWSFLTELLVAAEMSVVTYIAFHIAAACIVIATLVGMYGAVYI